MRPVQPIKIVVERSTTPPSKEDEVWTAITSFIDAFVRHQIEKMRAADNSPLTDPTSDSVEP